MTTTNTTRDDDMGMDAPPPEDPAGSSGLAALALRRPGDAQLATVETQTDALAAAAAREMEVRYALARRFPREVDIVERRLLADCVRPGFAERARYRRPVGKKKDEASGEWVEQYAEGFSIRFAESALAALGNMDVAGYVIYEDAEKARVRCVAVDLETNGSWRLDVDVPKTVERRKLKKGQRAMATRENSYGETVYVVPATPEEFRTKQAAEVSKGLRTLILRLVPADVKEACEAQVKATLTDEFRKQSGAVVGKLVEAFARLKISKDEIGAYLGHPVEQMTSDESVEMRAIYVGITEGSTTWATLQAERRGDVEGDAGAPSTVDRLKSELAARVAGKRAAAGQAAPSAPAASAAPSSAPADSQSDPHSAG